MAMNARSGQPGVGLGLGAGRLEGGGCVVRGEMLDRAARGGMGAGEWVWGQTQLELQPPAGPGRGRSFVRVALAGVFASPAEGMNRKGGESSALCTQLDLTYCRSLITLPCRRR